MLNTAYVDLHRNRENKSNPISRVSSITISYVLSKNQTNPIQMHTMFVDEEQKLPDATKQEENACCGNKPYKNLISRLFGIEM